MPQFVIPPLVKWTLGALGAAAAVHWVVKEVRRVNAEFHWLSREAKFVQFMDNRYLEIAMGTPEEFGAYLKADRERIGDLVKKYNIPRQ